MKLDKSMLTDFARGAAFLGAGGGGDPYIGRLIVQQEIRNDPRYKHYRIAGSGR